MRELKIIKCTNYIFPTREDTMSLYIASSHGEISYFNNNSLPSKYTLSATEDPL